MCLVLIQVSLSPPLSTTSLCFSSSHLNRHSVCIGDPWSASPTSPVGGWCHFPHSSSKVLSDSSCSDLSLRCILEPNYSGKRKGKYYLSLGYVPCCRWDRAHLKCTDWEWGGSIALLGGEKEVATHSSVLAWRIPGMGGAWWARLKWLGSSSSSNKLLGFPGGASGKEPTCHCRLDPLEEDMTTHFCILAWRIPWAKEPGGLQSMRSYRVGTTEAT